jgi:hypothetical protein
MISAKRINGSKLPRSRTTLALPTRSMRRLTWLAGMRNSSSRLTWGMAYRSPPVITIWQGMMARVKGSLMRIVVPLPGFRIDIDHAAQLVEVGFDHIHAHTAAGHIGDGFGCGETGQEDQVGLFPGGHHLGLLFTDQPFSTALAAMTWPSRPLPSSEISMLT